MFSILELIGKSLVSKRANSIFIEIHDGKSIYVDNSRTNESNKITFIEDKVRNNYLIFIESSTGEKHDELIALKKNKNKIAICSSVVNMILDNKTICITTSEEIRIFE